jgi:hypothetical protein
MLVEWHKENKIMALESIRAAPLVVYKFRRGSLSRDVMFDFFLITQSSHFVMHLINIYLCEFVFS